MDDGDNLTGWVSQEVGQVVSWVILQIVDGGNPVGWVSTMDGQAVSWVTQLIKSVISFRFWWVTWLANVCWGSLSVRIEWPVKWPYCHWYCTVFCWSLCGHLASLVLVHHYRGLLHTTQICHCVDMSFLVQFLPWRHHPMVRQESRRKISSSCKFEQYFIYCIFLYVYLCFSACVFLFGGGGLIAFPFQLVFFLFRRGVLIAFSFQLVFFFFRWGGGQASGLGLKSVYCKHWVFPFFQWVKEKGGFTPMSWGTVSPLVTAFISSPGAGLP